MFDETRGNPYPILATRSLASNPEKSESEASGRNPQPCDDRSGMSSSPLGDLQLRESTPVEVRGGVWPWDLPTGHWLARAVRLQFQLGPLVFFSTGFEALMYDKHFTQLDPDPARFIPPMEELTGNLEGVLVPEYPVEKPLSRFAFLPQTVRYVPFRFNRYSVTVQGTFEVYLGKFSAKSRKRLSHQIRAFAEYSGGTIDWREFRSTGEIVEFYRLAREILEKSWKGLAGEEFVTLHDAFRQQMLDLAQGSAALGYILFHAQQPVAYAFCAAQGEILFYVDIGYNAQFQEWSPGTVLLYLILEKLFAEQRFRVFDFCPGEGWYKEFFSNRCTPCASVFYFRRSARNVLILGSWSALSFLSASTGKILQRFGLRTSLFTRLKKWFGNKPLLFDRR